jgi:hypothetical protein
VLGENTFQVLLARQLEELLAVLGLMVGVTEGSIGLKMCAAAACAQPAATGAES